MIEVGTRSRQNVLRIKPPSGSITRTLNRDPHLSKINDGTVLTFSAGSANVSGSNGCLPGFVVNDVIEVTGLNLNNGFFTVTSIDAANHASLGLSPPPKNETSSSVTVLRTA